MFLHLVPIQLWGNSLVPVPRIDMHHIQYHWNTLIKTHEKILCTFVDIMMITQIIQVIQYFLNIQLAKHALFLSLHKDISLWSQKKKMGKCIKWLKFNKPQRTFLGRSCLELSLCFPCNVLSMFYLLVTSLYKSCLRHANGYE